MSSYLDHRYHNSGSGGATLSTWLRPETILLITVGTVGTVGTVPPEPGGPESAATLPATRGYLLVVGSRVLVQRDNNLPEACVIMAAPAIGLVL